ncbi:hypothetical protein M9Y10_028057 [Tritrichomonas musculus]|uniref:Chromosome segregation protein SMC n=1 Tax=Tritrichomonas musculus TaxID=1915356 RepID=A0ABR2KI77_9EUKA
MDDDSSEYSFASNQQSIRQRPTSQVRPSSPIDPMLDSKASQLESEIRQQNTSIKSVIESLKHLEGAQLPNMANTLQNLRTAIERIVVADIPNSLKPIEDDAARVRQKFDKFSSETSNKLQNLHEKLADTSSSIQQLLARYADLSTSTRSSVTEIDSDLQRSKDTLDNAAARLTSLEGGLSQADDILRSLKTEIQALTRSFNEKVTQFQNDSTAKFNTTAGQLNNALKSETKVRLQTMSQIHQQIQDVNRNTTEAMTKMLSYLTTTKNQYQQALMSLSKAAKEGLVSCSSSAQDGFDELNNRMTQFVTDSNAQFESLENDVTSTIQALRQHIVGAREGLEVAITNVSRARINGETEIVARYDQLKANLSQQLKQQAEHMEEVCEKSIQSVVDHCESTLAQIRDELAQVRGQIGRIEMLQQRVSKINSSAEQTRSQLADQISSLGQRYAELLTVVEKTDREFQQRQEAIEARLSALENPDNQPNYATKVELDEIVQRTQQMFDGRLQEIERQINQIFTNISALQLTQGRITAPSGGTAADMLNQLVQKQTK